MDEWIEQLTAAVASQQHTLDWCRHYFRIVSPHPPLLAALYTRIERYVEKRSSDRPHSVSIDSAD